MPEVLQFLVDNPWVAALSLVLFLLLGFLLRDRSLVLKMGDKEITFKKDSQDKAALEKDPCDQEKKCHECRLKVFDATKKRIKLVHRLREELFLSQIKYADNKLDFLFQKLSDDYIILLAKHLSSPDYKMEKSFLLYKYKVLSFRHDILAPRIETVIRENHLLEKTPDQWKDHKAQVLEGVSADIGHFIDTQYVCEEVPREALEAFHVERWPFLSGKVIEVLDNARSLAQEYDIKIKEVKNRSSAEIFGACHALKV